MGRSDGVLAELGQEMWYSKRIRASKIVLIGHQHEWWYFDWIWTVGVMKRMNLDKIGEALAYLSRTDACRTDYNARRVVVQS